ncbi:uncharacterized protein PHALS_09725 [Plasmopara halstedii]|uniref:Uncharacterized protein n=1 Tax=Plasmopara halstedii TaxID=4781 RepID=A0A0P1AG17_PLAHL|nr:uncharacterized protein PHALS_09725 [Plasmopara halstedii]CEG39481.1 hypothetical protein PHALS_09725 [Plasmopara halstedii]|eukprot:XP_024575850.1 hypothetical protein PHALS_09725 [Plasmopara halstedii]
MRSHPAVRRRLHLRTFQSSREPAAEEPSSAGLRKDPLISECMSPACDSTV